MGGYKGNQGSWLTSKKELPAVPEPIIILAAGLGLLLGFYFKVIIAQYLFITLSLIFATVADMLVSIILVIGVSLFMIYSLKHSTLLKTFLIWVLVGVLLAAVVALPFVQQALGEGYELLKNSILLMIIAITIIGLVLYYTATKYTVVQKGDISGYKVAQRKRR